MARHDVIRALNEQGIVPDDMLVLPLPLGMMWRVLVIDGDDVLESWVSFADDDKQLRFDRIPRHLDRLGELQSYPPVERLRWFTRDFVALRESDNFAVLSDLRMGSVTNPVFSFEIAERRGDEFHPILTRDRLVYVCVPEIIQLMKRTFNAEPPLPIASLRGKIFSRDGGTSYDVAADPEQVVCQGLLNY